MDSKKILVISLFSVAFLSLISLSLFFRQKILTDYEKLANFHEQIAESKLDDKESTALVRGFAEQGKDNFEGNLDALLASSLVGLSVLCFGFQRLRSRK